MEALPRDRLLCFATFTTPTCANASILESARELLGAFSARCDGAWLVADDRERANGVHVHGVMSVSDVETVEAMRAWWLARTGAHPRANTRVPVTGLDDFAEGRPRRLTFNVAKIVRYVTDGLPSGRGRDLTSEVLVSGRFMRPWTEFAADGGAESLLPVWPFCEGCELPVAPGRRGQRRRYHGARCRMLAWRRRERRKRESRERRRLARAPRKVGNP